MRALIIPALAAAMLVPGASAIGRRTSVPPEAKLEQRLAGLTPGKPSGCLDPTLRSPSTEVYGKTILFVVSRNRIYRTDTAGGCESVARGDAFITRTSTQLCRGDIAQVFDPVSHAPTGSCSFGDFTQYTR